MSLIPKHNGSTNNLKEPDAHELSRLFQVNVLTSLIQPAVCALPETSDDMSQVLWAISVQRPIYFHSCRFSIACMFYMLVITV